MNMDQVMADIAALEKKFPKSTRYPKPPGGPKSREALSKARLVLDEKLGKPSDKQFDCDDLVDAFDLARTAILSVSTRIDSQHIMATAWCSFMDQVDVDEFHPCSVVGENLLLFHLASRLAVQRHE